jgi:hypothetical protein
MYRYKKKNPKEGLSMRDEVRELMRGTVTTAHAAGTAATATSSAIDCRGFNGILIDFAITGAANWTISITGCDTDTGTFKNVYLTDSTTQMSLQLNANRVWSWKGVPNYIKVVATEDADGQTVTVKAQPIKL